MSDPGNHPDTPNIPTSSAVLRIQSSILIDAPIQDVWNALTDTSTYPKWNRFVPRVTVRKQPEDSNSDDAVLRNGTKFTFHVNMYPETNDVPQPDASGLQDTFLQIIEIKAPTTEGKKGRVVWASDPDAGGLVSALLTAERVHEVSEVEDGNGNRVTEVRNWESQVGYLAYAVKWMFEGRLRGNFGAWEEGLKGFAESEAKNVGK
ncbi:hypothetical protein ASPVEDRAFT_51363 [Aspergillus versicolor CBS 583.65]|uniref:Uncharacterized protein n=1 Tax=Aspergillus versicolor CBS 583.65 TaxID=1036611 RepID=A0A1L9PF32_ASPVE|nr:uncharacterized protein ASPVEDRAFT_51363 [Aspergillus versicolor CBS 583.65]OJJ00110.1 hypothetical protein ASPVEDRAFT_51363 [Aspergillus versicolor CBS 583.65]